jgi:hypothetical protein
VLELERTNIIDGDQVGIWRIGRIQERKARYTIKVIRASRDSICSWPEGHGSLEHCILQRRGRCKTRHDIRRVVFLSGGVFDFKVKLQ